MCKIEYIINSDDKVTDYIKAYFPKAIYNEEIWVERLKAHFIYDKYSNIWRRSDVSRSCCNFK